MMINKKASWQEEGLGGLGELSPEAEDLRRGHTCILIALKLSLETEYGYVNLYLYALASICIAIPL